MDPRIRRIKKEIADIQNDKTSGLTVEMVDGSMTHLIGTFPGPEGSPYEGGHFQVDIDVVEGYPFQPLKMRFITKVYHPNISSASGAICLDILTPKAWSPVLTLRSTLVSLRSLLCSPEPNDPQDATVASHYKADRKGFEETAKFWTECYAKAPSSASSSSSAAAAGSAATTTAAPGKTGGAQPDPILAAGLDAGDVDKFEKMGFSREQVIGALARKNYRGTNKPNVSDDAIVEALLG